MKSDRCKSSFKTNHRYIMPGLCFVRSVSERRSKKLLKALSIHGLSGELQDLWWNIKQQIEWRGGSSFFYLNKMLLLQLREGTFA